MQFRRILVLFAVTVLIATATSARSQVFIGPRDVIVANVTSVETGTDLLLDTGQRVVLLGVAWLGPSRRSQSAASFAEASTAFVRNLVQGKRVYLHFDKQKYDLDGNLVAYVYLLKDGQSVNAEVIRHGYARAFGGFYMNASSYARLQRQAWQANSGLWARLPRPARQTAPAYSARPGQPATNQPGDVAELTTLDLRPTKPYVASVRANALNNMRPSDRPIVTVPLQPGAQLFIGGGPTNVGKVTQAVRKKVNQGSSQKDR
jgi:hypothetical protein